MTTRPRFNYGRSPTFSVVHNPDGGGFAEGERTIIFGPNGAGKTTQLRVLAGILPGGPGLDSAYLPQTPYLFRGLAGWNLGLGLDSEEAGRARHLAGRLGLDSLLARPARTLSGGERQRLALARVLAGRERWVLLDEPLAALDSRDRMRVAGLIVEAIGDRSAVIVTHARDEAAAMGTRLVVMAGGGILQQGPVEEVFSLPASEEVAQVVGIANVIDGYVVEAAPPLVEVKSHGIFINGVGDVPVGSPCRALFGAEAVTVYRESPATQGSARNRWSGTVVELRSSGALVEVVADVGVRVVALLTAGSLDALDLAPGRPVALAVKATAVSVVPTASTSTST